MFSSVTRLPEPAVRWLRSHRSRLCWLAVVGFVAGFFVMPFGELQMSWFALFAGLGLLPGVTRPRLSAAMNSLLVNRMLLAGMGLWLLLTLTMPGEAEGGWWPTARVLLNVPLLLVFFIVIQRAAWQGATAVLWLLRTIVGAAMISVIASIFMMGSLSNLVNVPFRNLLVYTEGLNPVLTGLSCGFGAIIALSLARKEASDRGFIAWWVAALLLEVAAFFTHSRCAMLGLLAGTGVLFATTAGWRRWGMILPLLLGVAVYALAAPITDLGAPLQQLVLRADTGRFAIYSAVWCRMQDAFHFTFGHGLFAAEGLPEGEAGSMAFHVHSMYLAAFYHGGVVGLLLLLAVLFTGLQRAWHCLHHGQDPTWLALLCFGMVGLLFDGSMPLRLMTITRIEPLIVLFPLAMACALAARIPVARAQPAHVSVEEEDDRRWGTA